MEGKEKKRRTVLVVALAVAAVVLGMGMILRSWIRMPELPKPPAELPEQGAQLPVKPAGNRKEGVYTFLLAGRDVASGSTDTMLLLSYDTKAKTINGLNLPRDTMMNVSTSSKRLNAVFSYNRGQDKDTQVAKGMTALKGAVAELTGIVPDFYVLVEWEAIGELVDAVGGVEFEVPFDMKYDDPYQDPPLHIDQKAGMRVLNGEDAMEVIRWRKNNDGGGGGGDIARLGIQQDFLKAVVKKCLQPAIVLKFNSLVEIFKENVETDLTVGNILAFAEQAIGMNPDTGVTFATAPLADSFKYNRAALVTLDAEGMLEIVNSSLNPYLEDITVDELKIVVRKGDGSFAVTSGELAEGINKYVREPKPEPKPEEPVKPEIPVEGEVDEGDVPAEGEISDPGFPGEGEPVEPDAPMEGETEVPETPEDGSDTEPEVPEPDVPVQPELPEQDVPADPPTETVQPAPEPEEPAESVPEEQPVQAEEAEDEIVAVLPPRPVPVEQAA